MQAESSSDAPFIVRFYKSPEQGSDGARDSDDRSLDDIMAFNNRQLEYYHDYIQVLFPLPERSPINPGAPVITAAVRDAFAEDENLRQRLTNAFSKMANFYGFDVAISASGPIVTPKADFVKIARQNWLTQFDHNHLRISRIIRCLRILGLEPLALAFHQALKENARGVSPKSLMYWQRAAERPLHLPPNEDNDQATGIAWLRDDSAS